MKYSITDGNLNDLRTPCLVVSLKTAKRVARALGSTAIFSRASEDFKDSVEQSLCVNLGGNIARLLVIGGADETLDADKFRKLVNAAAVSLLKLPVKNAIVALDSVKVTGERTPWKAATLMHAISYNAYRYGKHKSKPASPPTLTTVRVHVSDKKGTTSSARLGNALDAGLAFSRDLGNEPPNVCDPNYLLKEARKLAKHPEVSVSNLDEKKMAALNMGAFLSVSKGSDKPGQMIVIRYNGGRKADAPIALVGKGITFDTGGISLKPGAAMDEMKFDMCGAASVLGTTKAVIQAGLKINLITIVAAAENMPSGGATRPGDIVTSSSGKTIEILNTDAEGRLVLCDALTHAQTFKPKTIIDVATLTGAVIVALGSKASAVYANDDKLANDLLAAGQTSGDKAWQMPLWDEYQSSLNSNFADMANIGGREAGSVTAACFLSRFVEGVSWAHMDVAGSAFMGGAAKGATGRPVPLLFNYLCQQANGQIMTRVDFYILDDQTLDATLRFACRLGLKAYLKNTPVHVHMDKPEDAQALDELMWDYPKHRFVPHEIITGESVPSSPIQISCEPPHIEEGLLINLAPDVPRFFGRFDRVAEIVVGETRDQGRARYAHYRSRGYPLHHHQMTDWEQQA